VLIGIPGAAAIALGAEFGPDNMLCGVVHIAELAAAGIVGATATVT
jgi:hypothetical protein